MAQAAKPPAVTSSLLNAEKLRALYTAMVKCRMVTEGLGTSRRRNPAFSRFGTEAVLAGTISNLLSDDCCAPTPSAALAGLVRGAPLAEVFRAHRQAENAPPASLLQLGIGAGLALAFKTLHQPHVALCLLKEELLLSNDWKEALVFAAKRKLPLVCVVETRSLVEELRITAEGCRAPAITVDGADVVAVYRVTQEAARRARQGHGPTLIECKLQATADPVSRMEDYLRNRGFWSDAWRIRLVENFKKELQRARHLRT